MINTDSIYYYNKVVAFSRKQYCPWDPKERKEMESAAPLLKFTIEKRAQAAEDKNVGEILNAATRINSTHVIIGPSFVQFICLEEFKLTEMHIRQILCSYFISPNDISVYSTDPKLVDVYAYSNIPRILMIKSKANGIYSKNSNGVFELQRTSKKIIEKIDQLGFVSIRGRTPRACSTKNFSLKDINESEQIIDFCYNNNFSGNYASKFAKIMRSHTARYIWPNYKDFSKKINKIMRKETF